jgi:hypothetical protein
MLRLDILHVGGIGRFPRYRPRHPFVWLLVFGAATTRGRVQYPSTLPMIPFDTAVGLSSPAESCSSAAALLRRLTFLTIQYVCVPPFLIPM